MILNSSLEDKKRDVVEGGQINFDTTLNPLKALFFIKKYHA